MPITFPFCTELLLQLTQQLLGLLLLSDITYYHQQLGNADTAAYSSQESCPTMRYGFTTSPGQPVFKAMLARCHVGLNNRIEVSPSSRMVGPDPIFVKDREHRLVLVNDAECALAGRSREEMLGGTDYDFFPKEQVDIFWENDEIVLTTGKEHTNDEEITNALGWWPINSSASSLSRPTWATKPEKLNSCPNPWKTRISMSAFQGKPPTATRC